jgi:hypothetical protein
MNKYVLAVFAIVLGLSATAPALAAKNAMSIPVGSMSPYNGVADIGALVFANTGSPRVRVNFSLPGDYKAGTTARLRLHFGSDEACQAQLSIDFATRARSGQSVIQTGAGIALTNAAPLTLNVGDIHTKTIEIRPAAGLSGQKPGDIFGIVLVRNADAVTDNCSGNFMLVHAELRYTVR